MITNDTQMYYKKPNYLEGGKNTFNSVSEDQIVSIDPLNENGSYSISRAGDSVMIKRTGS